MPSQPSGSFSKLPVRGYGTVYQISLP